MSNKTERQKALAGEFYLASDPELAALHKRARRLARLLTAVIKKAVSRVR